MQYGLNRTARNDQFNSVSASTTRSAGSAATASQENNGSSSCGVHRPRLVHQSQQPRAVADYGTRVVATLAHRPQIQRVQPLRHPSAIGRIDQRQVRELRRIGRPQASPHIQLNRRGPQQVAPAHNLRDAHRHVIYAHRQLVGEQPVGTTHHHVAQLPRQIEALRPEHARSSNRMTRSDSGAFASGTAMRHECRFPRAIRSRRSDSGSRRQVPG